jgi:hypothetical protein
VDGGLAVGTAAIQMPELDRHRNQVPIVPVHGTLPDPNTVRNPFPSVCRSKPAASKGIEEHFCENTS